MATPKVRHTGKQLEVFAVDLTGAPKQVLKQIRRLAVRVQAMASTARSARTA